MRVDDMASSFCQALPTGLLENPFDDVVPGRG